MNTIEKALELLGPNGENWTRGHERTPDGKMCVWGALRTATEGLMMTSEGIRLSTHPSTESFAAAQQVHHVIVCEFPQELSGARSPALGITVWNDDIFRKFDEVRAVMEKAAQED